jgi:hypothetical protein
MIFEVQDLAVASPATVSRCGMVYVEPEQIGWRPLRDSWMASALPPGLGEEARAHIQGLFEWLVDPCVVGGGGGEGAQGGPIKKREWWHGQGAGRPAQSASLRPLERQAWAGTPRMLPLGQPSLARCLFAGCHPPVWRGCAR